MANGFGVRRAIVWSTAFRRAFRRRYKQARAVNHRAGAGMKIDRVNPPVFFQIRREDEATSLIIAFWRDPDLFVGLQDQVWFSESPLLAADQVFDLLLGVIFSVAAWRAAFNPRDQYFDVALRKRVIVREAPITFDDLERRHTFFQNFFLDRLRPGARLFVSRQRNVGFDLAGSVAGQA